MSTLYRINVKYSLVFNILSGIWQAAVFGTCVYGYSVEKIIEVSCQISECYFLVIKVHISALKAPQFVNQKLFYFEVTFSKLKLTDVLCLC